jgi:cytochrome b561
MKTAPATGKYSPLAMTLHWWIAAMIVLQFVLANLVESTEDAGSETRALALLTRHRSVGITPLVAILALVHIAAALEHALIDRDGP